MGENTDVDTSTANLGMTLRSLLENHDLMNLRPPVKRTEKDDKEGADGYNMDASVAFLGPTLWDKTLSDFKLEYIDLDELLGENITNDSNTKAEGPHHPLKSSSSHELHTLVSSDEKNCSSHGASSPLSLSSSSSENNASLDYKFSSTELALATVPGHEHFDPTVHTFSEDELKPQPMIKKSKKHLVPEDQKDEKYWVRRQKNNLAAKRSREARRVKENQIVLRASYLEKENLALKDEVEKLRGKNEILRNNLKKYEP